MVGPGRRNKTLNGFRGPLYKGNMTIPSIFNPARRGLLVTFLALFYSACGGADSNLRVFAEIPDGPSAPVFTCTTTCDVNIFNDPEKQNLVLQASFGTPRNCDEFSNLLRQNWEIAQFDLGNSAICSQLGGSNPTELVCTVTDGGEVATTYLGQGVFPFVPQGCGRTNLIFTVFINNLLTFDQAGLADFTCDSLETAYDANDCTPDDAVNPVCASLNALKASGTKDCFL